MSDHFQSNLQGWQDASVCRSYSRQADLYSPEVPILKRLEQEFHGKKILDLGVGGGRTTPYLLKISPHYTGSDYSPPMIEECRRLYPGITFQVVDARDLSQFGEQSFDLVMFSANGIDNFDQAGRMQCLTAVRHVLSPSGAFIFSTHNRSRDTILKSWSLRHFHLINNPTLNPLKLVNRAIRYAQGIANSMKMKPLEKNYESYALLNDDGDQYRFISYHISPEQQVRQLSEAGFKVEQMVDTQGQDLDTSNAKQVAGSWMVYYVCRKADA